MPTDAPEPTVTITHLDWGDLSGGLVRMMERFREKGTLTDDFEADAYLRQDPNAALLGLLYDQRVRAEFAFTGPIRLRERLGHLDMQKIAEMDPGEFQTFFAQKPAVHRFTNKMAETTQKVAKIIAEEHGGDAANLWCDDCDSVTLAKRVKKLPGFGKQKASKMKYVVHYFGYRDFSDE